MSNLGRWAAWYAPLPADAEPQPFRNSAPTYELGAEFLKGCALVEDWGCGKGWMRTLIPPERYRGIDGTASPFADEVVDLATYRSQVPGIYMRGVIEHCYDWETVLANAVASFTQRMALVIFTPLAETTREIAFVEELGVPDISFRLEDLEEAFESPGNIHWDYAFEKADTGYSKEWIFYLERE